jgi:hypothetical protein
MICIRCVRQEMAVGHSCTDDLSRCKTCDRARVVVVESHDDRGWLSVTQTCLVCLPKTNGAK